MKHTKLFLGAMAAAFLASCSSDDAGSAPQGTYDDGVLVVNEGNATTGTVSFIGDDMTTLYQDIFGAANSGATLGGYVQSIFFDGDRAFVISNGSNKITVVNRYTFELIGTIATGFNVPRYGLADGDRAYVTNLASFDDLTDDFVSVIDLETLTVVDSYEVGAIAERIEDWGNHLFVSNGSFGMGNTITVIDRSNGSVVETIETGLSPNSIEMYNGKLYALCSDFSSEGRVLRIDPDDFQVEETFGTDGITGPQNLAVSAANEVYFTAGTSFYRYHLGDIDPDNGEQFREFETGAEYIYGFAVRSGKAYVADAKQFSSAGTAFIYDRNNGSLIDSFATGVAPNGFYFN